MGIAWSSGPAVSVSTRSEEKVHLVGAPKLEIERILADAGVRPSESEQGSWLNPLATIAASYRHETFKELETLVRCPVELVTGNHIASAIRNAQADMREGDSEINLTSLPVINLAPLTIKIAEQVSDVRGQVMEVSADGGTVSWGAPEFQVRLSRAVFHNLRNTFEANRAGFVGEGRTLYEQFRDIAQHLQADGHSQVLVIDDRCSASGETMKYVRDRLKQDQVSVLAFVVGHAAMAARGIDGEHPRIDGVRVIAPIFRFASHSDSVDGRTAGIADELKDIGYSSSAGNCYMEGYDDDVRDRIARVERILNTAIVDARVDIGEITREAVAHLVANNVTVPKRHLLEQFIGQKKQANHGAPELVQLKDLRDLFAPYGGYLKLEDKPYWNPKLAAPARLPTLWPGDPQQNSFNRLLDKFNTNNPKEGWLRLSYAQLTATINMLEGLHEMLDHRIPRSAFPFLEMNQVRDLLPERFDRASLPAIDVLWELRDQVGETLGKPRSSSKI